MDKRQIFERVKTHLLAQGEKALDSIDECVYRHKRDDGVVLRCAVGRLIDDEHYNINLEGGDVSYKPVVAALNRSLRHQLTRLELDFLRGLQLIHDDYEPDEWPERLREFEEASV